MRKVRDFGALFNDGIAFLRKNYKTYFGSIMYLAGPFIIVTGLLSGYMQSLQSKLVGGNLFTSFRFGSDAGLFSANFFGTLGIFILISVLTTLVTVACICLYFKEYDKTPSENLPITRSMIASGLASAAWRLFYNLIILSLMMGLVGLLIVGVLAVLFIVPVLNILVGIALVIGLLIIVPVLIYVIYVSNYIIIRDEVLITDAFGKAWRYMKGNFWWTWLLMVAVTICVGTLASLLNLPLTILTFTKAFSRSYDSGSDGTILYVIFGALSMIGQLMLVSPVLYTFCIFNFHNHEERHEGTGLLNRIDELDALK